MVLKNIFRRFIWPIYIVLKNTIKGFTEDKVHRMGASIAYYTIFSLPALLMIIIAVVGLLFGKAAVEGRVYETLIDFVGSDSAHQVQNVVKSLGNTTTNWWMTIIGAVFLVFIATNIFFALQATLNEIFEVEEVPRKVKFIQMIINRSLSFVMIICISLLLVLSIFINGFIFTVSAYVQSNKIWLTDHMYDAWAPIITYISDSFLTIFNQFVSISFITVFFVLIYKILPAVNLRWKFIWAGSLFAAVLFWMGQLVISYYLQNAGFVSAYGAAGFLIAILIWVYYCAQLIFVGAEFTKALCLYRGVTIKPKLFAKRLQNRKKAWINKRRFKDENGVLIDIFETRMG
jgi:membrane protein